MWARSLCYLAGGRGWQNGRAIDGPPFGGRGWPVPYLLKYSCSLFAEVSSHRSQPDGYFLPSLSGKATIITGNLATLSSTFTSLPVAKSITAIFPPSRFDA